MMAQRAVAGIAAAAPEECWLHEWRSPTLAEAAAAAQRLGSADAFVAGVLDVAAARLFALDTVLRLCAIEWTADVATACVECTDRPRLLLNPAFVERWCPTRERLGMLLLHELAHVSLGHARLFPRSTALHNVALDVVINRELLAALGDAGADVPRFAALLESSYAPDQSPWFILRAPPGWPVAPEWNASAACPRALRDIHRRLYDAAAALRTLRPDGRTEQRRDARHGVLYGEIIAALQEAHPLGTRGLATPVTHGPKGQNVGDSDEAVLLDALLGGHGLTDRERAATSGGRDAVAGEVLGDALAKLSGRFAGDGGDLTEYHIERAAHSARLERSLRALLRRVFVDDGARRGSTSAMQSASRTVDPASDRRAPARMALARHFGAPRPLLFDGSVLHPRPVPRDAVVYLDVSGSMSGVLPALHGALVRLRRELRPRIYVFSTVVAEVRAAEFDGGWVPTTGGTSVAPVLEHLLAAEHTKPGRMRRCAALVITDGYFDAPSVALRERARAAGLAIHLAVGGPGPLWDGADWIASTTRIPGC